MREAAGPGTIPDDEALPQTLQETLPETSPALSPVIPNLIGEPLAVPRGMRPVRGHASARGRIVRDNNIFPQGGGNGSPIRSGMTAGWIGTA